MQTNTKYDTNPYAGGGSAGATPPHGPLRARDVVLACCPFPLTDRTSATSLLFYQAGATQEPHHRSDLLGAETRSAVKRPSPLAARANKGMQPIQEGRPASPPQQDPEQDRKIRPRFKKVGVWVSQGFGLRRCVCESMWSLALFQAAKFSEKVGVLWVGRGVEGQCCVA